jgi:integrase
VLTVGMFKHNQTDYWHLDIPAELSPTGRRNLPIIERMEEILEEVRRGLRKDPDPKDLVWPFQRAAIGMAFARARDQAEVGKGHFHALRDTFAVWYLRNGGSYHILSKILGHSSVLITEKYYAHVPIGDIENEMERLTGEIWKPCRGLTRQRRSFRNR